MNRFFIIIIIIIFIPLRKTSPNLEAIEAAISRLHPFFEITPARPPSVCSVALIDARREGGGGVGWVVRG